MGPGHRTFRSLIVALLAFMIITPLAVRSLLKSTACIEPIVLRTENGKGFDIRLLSPLGSPVGLLETAPGEFSPWTPTAVGSIIVESTTAEQTTVEVIIGNSAGRSVRLTGSGGQDQQALASLSRGSRLSGYFDGALNYKGDIWVCCLASTNGLLIGLLMFCCVHQLSRLLSIFSEILQVLFDPVTLSAAIPLVIVLGLMGMRNSDPLALSYRYVDEWIIVEGILNWPQFWDALYGSLYNVLLLLASVPGLTADDLQLVVIGQRLVSAVAAAWSVGLICFMAAAFLKRPFYLLAALPVLSMPGFWTEASIIRPDWPMTLCCLLAFALLLKDQGQYGISFLGAVAAFAAAMAVKPHALMLTPALIFYVGLSYREAGFISKVLRMALVFVCVYPLLDFEMLLLSKSMELMPLIFKIIFAQSGVGQLSVKLPAATVGQKMQVLDSLFLSPLLFFAFQILGVVGALLMSTNRSMRGCVAAVGCAFAISVHHLFLLTLAFPTYSVIWTTLVTAASSGAGWWLLQRWLSPRYIASVAGVLVILWVLAVAAPRREQFRSVAADYYVSVGEGAELQQQTWRQIQRLIGFCRNDRVNVLSSALVCIDADMVWRKSFDLSRIWYDNMRVVQGNRDYLQGFDIIVLKIRGQERVSEGTLLRLQESLPEFGFKLAFQNSLVRAYALEADFGSEAFD